MDNLTKDQRSKNMRAIKSNGTKIEQLLGKALWQRGYRYRKNDNTVFGKPDITFKRLKIAVFCDSEFWHGKDWAVKKEKPKTNKKYWYNKIERNIKRDKEVNLKLQEEGWIVLRFWGKDIEKKLDCCINKIEKVIQERKNEKI